ncbi:MAG: quinolinate synthase NadA [Alphaproteobacteria bacterium]|nr:quinolinate synthase NadA [Alphaproteobacteria bacterium]
MVSSTLDDALRRNAALYEHLKPVISENEWATMVEDIDAIVRLKKERNAVILAHNYMRPEIFHGVADVRGDSLALARKATAIQADVVVMAGVHFMAETVKLLNPSRTVLIPDPLAGCSLADSITPEDVHALRAQYPGVPVVTYVNTSAAVKAVSDLCCTSGNAKKIVESLNVPRVIMIPDEYLAQNTARQTKVEIVTWKGHCEVHERFTPDDIRLFREQTPGVTILAHPECPPSVVEGADYTGSTADMMRWINEKKPEKAVLLTEGSMSDNVSIQAPQTTFIRPCELCPHMKRITLAGIRKSLETMETKVDVPEALAEPARRAVERMIAVS